MFWFRVHLAVHTTVKVSSLLNIQFISEISVVPYLKDEQFTSDRLLRNTYIDVMEKSESNELKKEKTETILGPVKIFIWILGGLAALALLLYLIRFFEHGWSTDPADWGVFGDYIGGVLNPLISLITLLVTIRIAIRINEIDKRNHDETINSQVKPVLTIEDRHFFSADISRIGITAMSDFYSYAEPEAPINPFSHLHQEPFYLPISNIGLGLAIGAAAEFKIDFSECKQAIDLDKDGYKFEMVHQNSDAATDTNSGIIRFDLQGREKGSSRFISQTRKWVGVIDNKKEFAKIILPDDIVTAFQFFNLRRRLQYNDTEFPVIDLTITYKNIHGGNLSAKYKIGLFSLRDYPHFSVYKLVAAEQENTEADP